MKRYILIIPFLFLPFMAKAQTIDQSAILAQIKDLQRQLIVQEIADLQSQLDLLLATDMPLEGVTSPVAESLTIPVAEVSDASFSVTTCKANTLSTTLTIPSIGDYLTYGTVHYYGLDTNNVVVDRSIGFSKLPYVEINLPEGSYDYTVNAWTGYKAPRVPDGTSEDHRVLAGTYSGHIDVSCL